MAGTFQPEKRYALVITNTAYVEGRSGLAELHCENDADAMAEFLEGLGFEVTKCINATADEINNHFTAFEAKDLNVKRLIFVYYSGRGGLFENDTVAIGIDGKLSSLTRNTRALTCQKNVYVISLLDCSRVPLKEPFQAVFKTANDNETPEGFGATIYATSPSHQAVSLKTDKGEENKARKTSFVTASFINHMKEEYKRHPGGSWFPACVKTWSELTLSPELVFHSLPAPKVLLLPQFQGHDIISPVSTPRPDNVPEQEKPQPEQDEHAAPKPTTIGTHLAPPKGDSHQHDYEAEKHSSISANSCSHDHRHGHGHEHGGHGHEHGGHEHAGHGHEHGHAGHEHGHCGHKQAEIQSVSAPSTTCHTTTKHSTAEHPPQEKGSHGCCSSKHEQQAQEQQQEEKRDD